MLGDALGSVAIIGGALVIRLTGWQRIDPLLSAIIGALIIWTAWDIIKETLNILLEGLPRGLELHEVTTAMRACGGRARRARRAYLEPGLEHARVELPRADRGPAAFGERVDSAGPQPRAG